MHRRQFYSNSIIRKAILSLPAGAIGAWYGDQATTANGGVIPNALGSGVVSQNILRAPRRNFANGSFWSGGGSSITDANATAWDGSNDASTINAPSGTAFSSYQAFKVPTAGNYTIAIWVKAGSSVTPFQMGFQNTPSPTITPTSTWTRQTFTAALSAGTNYAYCVVSNSNGVNILVSDVAVYPGSSDLGANDIPQGDLYFGGNGTTSPTISGGTVDLSVSGVKGGFAQFAGALGSNNYTLIAVAKKTTTAAASYQAMIYNGGFSPMIEHQFALPANNGTGNNFTGLASPAVGTWHSWGARYDGTNFTNIVDGAPMVDFAVGAPAISTLRDFQFGTYNRGAYQSVYTWYAWAFWPRVLSDAEVLQAHKYLAQRASSKAGITVGGNTRYAVMVGDSIGFGTNAQTPSKPYFAQAGLAANAGSALFFGANLSIPGYTLANVQSRWNTRLQAIATALKGNGNKLILYSEIGTNDYQSDPNAWLTSYAAALDQWRSFGYDKVMVSTLFPTSVNSPTRINFVNNTRAGINGFAGNHADAVVDWRTDSTFASDNSFGAQTSASQTPSANSLSPDGLHMTDAGHTAALADFSSVLNAQ